MSPGDEEVVSESAQGSSFIQYPSESAEVRRPNEVPIRPKLIANGSGHGLGLGETGAGGSDVGTGAGGNKAGTRKSRSGSGSSTSSLEEEATGVESSASGSGLGATAVTVVPSSSAGSTSAVPAYASTGSAYPVAQGAYASSGEGYERSAYDQAGSTYEHGYGQSTLNFDQSSSGYDASGSGYSHPEPSYESSNAARYDPSGYGSSPVYPGFEPSSAGYGQAQYAGPSMPSPSHVRPQPSPSHVQVQPHPSPSHVQVQPLPGSSMYGTPGVGSSMHGTPSMHNTPLTMHNTPSSMHNTPSMHNASPSSNSSYFQNASGLYSSRSMPVMAQHVPLTRPTITRRPTLVPSLAQQALGLSLGQPKPTDLRDPMGRRPSASGAGPPSMPGSFDFSSAQPEGTGQTEIKQEDGAASGGMWSRQEVQGQPQGHGQEGERFQTGYQDARWAGAGPGSEPAGYHGYHAASASGMVGSAGGYPFASQQPQSQQQLYGQQGGGGFGDQQEQYRSLEGGGTYTEGSASFGMQANVGSDLPKLPHQQFPDYPWPGSEARWNRE